MSDEERVGTAEDFARMLGMKPKQTEQEQEPQTEEVSQGIPRQPEAEAKPDVDPDRLLAVESAGLPPHVAANLEGDDFRAWFKDAHRIAAMVERGDAQRRREADEALMARGVPPQTSKREEERDWLERYHRGWEGSGG